jgi:hypothetical protein
MLRDRLWDLQVEDLHQRSDTTQRGTPADCSLA